MQRINGWTDQTEVFLIPEPVRISVLCPGLTGVLPDRTPGHRELCALCLSPLKSKECWDQVPTPHGPFVTDTCTWIHTVVFESSPPTPQLG